MSEADARLSQQLAIANQALGSFSHSVSHDLRAPLRAVDSLVQIMEEDYSERLGEDGREILRVIHDACVRMDQLINGLLAFSQSVRQPIDTVPLDMTALARAAFSEALTSYTGPQASVEIAPLPPSAGDAALIRQVWANLIGNALKYSARRAEPKVQISGRIEGREVIYRVQDNGVGFDMQYVHKLFGVFQRLHKVDDYPGTGVGLAIAQRIIVRHGGRIWAESAPDAGAAFQFSLPVIITD